MRSITTPPVDAARSAAHLYLVTLRDIIPADAVVFYTAKELAAFLRPRLARKRGSAARGVLPELDAACEAAMRDDRGWDREAGRARVRLAHASETRAGRSPLRFYNGYSWWSEERA